MNKYVKVLYFFISLLFLEVLFKLVVFKSLFNISLINIFLYSGFISIIYGLVCSLFNERINKILFKVILGLNGLLFAFQECLYSLFGLFFSFNLFKAAGQTLEFATDIYHLIIKNFIWIVLFLVPFILSFFLAKKIDFEKVKGKKLIPFVYMLFSMLGLFYTSLLIGKNKEYSPYNLYFDYNETTLATEKLGVKDAFILYIIKLGINFEEDVVITTNPTNPENKEEKEYEYNNLDIDFKSLKENESNSTIKSMHEYFEQESGTIKNEYTGYFKNKNLILFMAESFNEIAVREDLTPTLYKLTHEGFTFNNFYTPTISSTIGGEFQELTGLYAASGFVSPWKEGKNAFPMGIANLFKESGYNTYAYHDHSYKFQNRYLYLKALGFDNFVGCFNGLESKMNCKQWPESDVELINATVDDYINSDKPFMTYYATVSGHGDYTYSGHAIASKNKDLVENLDYSSKVKVYLAAQIELDKALETLISKLKEAGKLDDTVIALVGDHYPYFLSNSEVNELSSYQKEPIVEINHSNFILWNNKMKTINIDKVGSQIDVLPTIYNIFNIKYDSRLIIGKDILSTEPGLAIFANRSWVSDYGTYYTSSNKFIAKEGKEIPENYVKNINNLVSNRVNMSKLIMTQDYYKKVLGD